MFYLLMSFVLSVFGIVLAQNMPASGPRDMIIYLTGVIPTMCVMAALGDYK